MDGRVYFLAILASITYIQLLLLPRRKWNRAGPSFHSHYGPLEAAYPVWQFHSRTQSRWASLARERDRCHLYRVIWRARGKLQGLPTPCLLSACHSAWNFPVIHCLGLLYRNTNKVQILSEGSHAAEMVQKKLEKQTKLGSDPSSLSIAVWYSGKLLRIQRPSILIYKNVNSINLVGLL